MYTVYIQYICIASILITCFSCGSLNNFLHVVQPTSLNICKVKKIKKQTAKTYMNEFSGNLLNRSLCNNMRSHVVTHTVYFIPYCTQTCK